MTPAGAIRPYAFKVCAATASRSNRPEATASRSTLSRPARARFGPMLRGLCSGRAACCSSFRISTSGSFLIRLFTARPFSFTPANFLCVETFHAAAGCRGILFNDPYGIPVVTLDDRAQPEVAELIDRLGKEQDQGALACGEVMRAYLKVLLILATRLKTPQASACGPGTGGHRHPMLVQLRDLIEQNYQTVHSPSRPNHPPA